MDSMHGRTVIQYSTCRVSLYYYTRNIMLEMYSLLVNAAVLSNVPTFLDYNLELDTSLNNCTIQA